MLLLMGHRCFENEDFFLSTRYTGAMKEIDVKRKSRLQGNHTPQLRRCWPNTKTASLWRSVKIITRGRAQTAKTRVLLFLWGVHHRPLHDLILSGWLVFSRLLPLVKVLDYYKQDPGLLFKPCLSASVHLAQSYLSNLTETILGTTP